MLSLPIRERINLALAVAGLACAGAVLSLGCGSGGPNGTSLIGNVGCDPAHDQNCHTVGESCQSDGECDSGSCSSGACASVGPTGGGGSTGSDELFSADDLKNDRSDLDSTCVDLDVSFQRITPTVMLLIDQSGSMNQPFESGKNRWQTLRETLTDPQNSLLKKLDSSVRFGVTLYTSNGGFGYNLDSPRTCPVLQSVGIKIGNFDSISRFLNLKKNGSYVYGPAGDTPTAESVDAVVKTLRGYQEDGPKSIILATDGDPDTCKDPNANDSDASKKLSVDAVTRAYQAGIPTHVISVGDEVTASHLEALAVAGSGGDANAVAYTALDTSALVAAFDAIIGSVRTCDFTLEGTVTPANAPRGKVVLDGQELTFGDANGWEMPDAQTVRLQGTACEKVEANAGGISMKFPCDAITIIPR
ncbi:MAG TPA: vWA domain-containing protein [Polyangiaceae bacterium]|nr:vWA domain-containing protein [Polyangiaceae bacterium]